MEGRMQLLEFQAKALLQQAGLPIPKGAVIGVLETVTWKNFPIVVKSQVPVGGRGKLGGVKLVHDQKELNETIATISSLEIKGHLPSHLLLEEAIDIRRELYVSLQVNRDDRRVEWIVSENGGVEIESHSGSVLIIDAKRPDAYRKISTILNLSSSVLDDVLKKLERCFYDNDLLLLEINPLIISGKGGLVCADAKVMVDDNARFRHENFEWPEAESVRPLGGNIGVIANGAGMAMSTMDTIYAAGAKPANFLDIGGGTGEDVFVKNLRIITELPGVTSIIVNIFAGITHCDDIARGIIAAKKQIPDLVPLYIRLEGTNRDEAATLLAEANIPLQPDLKTCIELATRKADSRQQIADETVASSQPTVDNKSQSDPSFSSHYLMSQGESETASLRSEDCLRPCPSSAASKEGGERTTPREEARSERMDGKQTLFSNQPVIVQGITGHHGMFHTEKMLGSGTNIVAGVTPGKGGQTVHNVPVYDSVKDALAARSATASVVFVPAPFAKNAVFEAIDAGLQLVVIITEGIPVQDMLAIHEKAVAANTTIIGPNCPGFIVPKSHKLGIIAAHITSPGHTTVISRSGTLTYELADALTKRGIGQRLILGIGGDPIQGMTFCDALKLAEADPDTHQIVLIGEIGGEGEIRAANYIDEHVTKPVYGLIVGHSLPPGQTFGHAGAIVSAHAEDAATKTAYLASCGVAMSDTLDELIQEMHP